MIKTGLFIFSVNPFLAQFLANILIDFWKQNLSTKTMSDSIEKIPKKLRKCKLCRKIVDTDLYDDHVKKCSSRLSKRKEEEGGHQFSCRMCYQKHPQLVLHLCYESPTCLKRYSRADYVELFEIFYRGLKPPAQEIKLKPSQLKVLYEVIEKNCFNSQSPEDQPRFCNSCGITPCEDSLENHFEGSPKCAKDYIKLSPKNCSSCNKPYLRLLFHLQENPECRSTLFQTLDPSKEERQLKSLAEQMRTCIGCGGEFKRNSILKHLGQKDACKSKYSNKQLEDLRNDCNIIKPLRMKMLNRKRTGVNSNKISKLKKKENPVLPHHRRSHPKQFAIDTVACISCGKDFPVNSILKHLTMMRECEIKYSPTELEDLTFKCEEQRRKNKNCRRNQKALEEKGQHQSKMKMSTRIKNFRSIKDKITSCHIECILKIDLKRVFHYKWELRKLERRLLPLRLRYNVNDIRDQLDNIVIKLEDYINTRVKEIKSCTAKWCFIEGVNNLTDRQHNDIKFVKSKSDILAVEVLDKFNKQLFNTVQRQRKTMSEIGLEMKEFENCEIYFNHPSTWINNVGIEKEKDAFIIEELTKLTKRYVCMNCLSKL